MNIFMILIVVVVVLVVAALLDFLVRRADFIAADYKGFIRFAILAIVIIGLIIFLLQSFGLMGGSMNTTVGLSLPLG